MSEQYSPTGFRVLPPVVKNLLIINVLMYLATITLTRFNIDLTDYLGLHFFKASDFRVYQIITYMFMHANFGHLFFNMFALWMFGNTLENLWGSQRFLLFYMVCGIGAGLCQELVQYIEFAVRLSDYTTVNTGSQIIPMATYLNMMNTVGASGAIYGLLLAFGMMFPNSMIYLYFLFPIKAKWFVIGYAVIELVTGLRGVDNVAHFAHLGGMLFGLGLILYWRHKSGIGRGGFSSWREYKPKKSVWERVKTTSSKDKSEKKSSETIDEYADVLAQRRARQAEVDRILEKVKQSGYDCLTDEEKKTIFDFRNR